jgi:hypothetical protein
MRNLMRVFENVEELRQHIDPRSPAASPRV